MTTETALPKRGRGRPKGSKNKLVTLDPPAFPDPVVGPNEYEVVVDFEDQYTIHVQADTPEDAEALVNAGNYSERDKLFNFNISATVVSVNQVG